MAEEEAYNEYCLARMNSAEERRVYVEKEDEKQKE